MLKKFSFFCLFISCLLCIFQNSFAYQEIPVISHTFTHSRFVDSHIHHGIRTKNNIPSSYSPAACYTTYNKAHYASLLPTDFQQAFKYTSDMGEILNNYPLYAFPNFIEFARTLPYYETYILLLNDKIQQDKFFRNQTAYMPYFENSFSPGYKNSGFHTFVALEAQKIVNAENLKASDIGAQKNNLQVNNFQDLDLLANHCIQKICEISQDCTSGRLADRIEAIHQTQSNNGKCFDYSSQVAYLSSNNINEKGFQHRYGTHLDCQLHKELCQTRSVMRQLEQAYSNDFHVQILAPVVYRCTLEAKNEQSPLAAFQLSDFCYTVTQVLSHGMHVLYEGSFAVGKGMWKGVNDFASIEHWKNMATGAASFGLLFADAIGQDDALHYALVLDAISNNSNSVIVAAEKYCEYTQYQKDVVNVCAQETYKKIKAMSWQEVVAHGAEIGTSIILDTLALNAVNGFSRTASNLVIKQLNSAVENGVLFTEQYAVEVAGFGKLIVEEGAEVANTAVDLVKNDLIFFNNEGKSCAQFMYEIENAKDFVNKSSIILTKTRSAWEATTFAVDKLETHFNKHVIKKAEWGSNISMTIDEYFNKAKVLLNSEINGCIDGFVSKQGWVFKYNKITNELAIAKPDGIIETLFRPTDGLNYWIDQIKKYK